MSGRATTIGWVALAALASSCAVFEPPLDGGRRDAQHAPDVGPPDSGRVADAGRDAESDAGPSDAGPGDAGASDAGRIPIPVRPTLAPCAFGAPVERARLMDARLDEVSGLVVSRDHPGVLWMIEDSGSAAVVYAVNDQGRLLATYGVPGVAIDYEDIGIGPGPDPEVDYLYIADIGDNDASRATITVYRAPEPAVAADQAFVSGALAGAEPLPMRYPPGMRDNAEALFVDPETEDVYLVTHNGFSLPNMLYVLSAPHTPAVPRELVALGGVYAGSGIDIAVSGADISPDGSHIVIRGLRAANHWTREPGVSIADTILTTTPCDAPLATEPKGESVGLAADGYFHMSEGASAPLYFVPFTP